MLTHPTLQQMHTLGLKGMGLARHGRKGTGIRTRP